MGLRAPPSKVISICHRPLETKALGRVGISALASPARGAYLPPQLIQLMACVPSSSSSEKADGGTVVWTARRSCIEVLHLTHMETIGVRELQQHASAALRRVERGETVGVTDRGRLVAVLIPPSSATGAGALLASGRVTPARRKASELPKAVTASNSSTEVLDDLRSER
jgi:prevent-host-death family protein